MKSLCATRPSHSNILKHNVWTVQPFQCILKALTVIFSDYFPRKPDASSAQGPELGRVLYFVTGVQSRSENFYDFPIQDLGITIPSARSLRHSHYLDFVPRCHEPPNHCGTRIPQSLRNFWVRFSIRNLGF